MFGINDSGKQQDNPAPTGSPSVAPAPVMPAPVDNGFNPEGSSPVNSNVNMPIVTPNIPAPDPGTAPEPSTAPAMPPMPEPQPNLQEESGVNGNTLENPISGAESPQITSNYGKSDPVMPEPVLAEGNKDDLLGLKRQALQSLAPLVDELDQTPEEKFKTTMMLIQASDNADLIKEAFAVANQITDEKTRAQALLDVVNEINYFTQPHQEDTEPETI